MNLHDWLWSGLYLKREEWHYFELSFLSQVATPPRTSYQFNTFYDCPALTNTVLLARVKEVEIFQRDDTALSQ